MIYPNTIISHVIRWGVGVALLATLVACGNMPGQSLNTGAQSSGASPSSATQTPSLEAPEKGTPMQATIEVDVFSGKPNPAWQPTDAQVAELLKKVKTLPETQANALPDNLGYRGFVARIPDLTTGTQTTIKVYHTNVQLMDANTTTYYRDDNRDIETWLFSLAKPNLPEELYKQISTAG